MFRRAVAVLLGLGFLLAVAALPAEAQVGSRCRLIDVTSVRFSPDAQIYNIGDLVTVQAMLKNFDDKDYNLTLFSVLNKPQWSTSADGAQCGPAPQPATASCAFHSNILVDPTGKSPILNLRGREVVISTGSDNNTTAVTRKGALPVDLVIQVTGEVPSISIQEERSFLRIRQERGGSELCTVVAETRAITSKNLTAIENCFQEADSAISKANRLISDARDSGLKSSDLADEQDRMDDASRSLQRAKDDYSKRLLGGTESPAILDNCNRAIEVAQRVQAKVREKIEGAGFSSFISGTVVPVIAIVVVVLLALVLLGRRRWDKL